MGTAGRGMAAGWRWRPHRGAMRALSACPAPELLAGYVERRLDLAPSAAVGAHLARCPRCRFVVGEALFFLGGDVLDDRRSGPEAEAELGKGQERQQEPSEDAASAPPSTRNTDPLGAFRHR